MNLIIIKLIDYPFLYKIVKMDMTGIKANHYYIYYRVSTQSQANDSAHGLDIQTQGCENYADKIFGIKEQQINYYCDIGSSYNLKSDLPQLRKLVKDLVPKSIIMVWDISRLGRDTIGVFSALKKIREKQCIIVSVKDYLTFGLKIDEDKLFYHKIVGAEADSDLKSVRFKTLLEKFRSKRIHMGTIPYGYKLDTKRKLVKFDKEQDILSTLKAKYKEVGSYCQVANYYNKTKMLYRGKHWSGRSIRYLLFRDSNINSSLIKQIDNCSLNCI